MSVDPNTNKEEQASSWQRLCEAANQPEATVLLSLLRSAGIECRIVQETVGSLYALNVGVLGVIGIEVPANQFATAKEILDAKFDESDLPE